MATLLYADGQLLYDTAHPFSDASLLSFTGKTEINKTPSLSFEMPPTHYMIDDLQQMKSLITVVHNGRNLFRGRVTDVVPDLYKRKKVTCEGDIAFLIDSIQEPYTGSLTIRSFLNRVISAHNSQVEDWKRFTLGRVTITEADETKSFKIESYQTTKQLLDSELLQEYGGVLETRTVGNTTYLDYVEDPFTSPSQSINSQGIRFGVNLVSYGEQYPVSELFTILVPIGKEKLTIASVNGGSIYLENQEAIAKFGRIYKLEEWSYISDANELLSTAQIYMNGHGRVFPKDLTLTAMDFVYFNSSEEEIKMGDNVLAEVPILGTREVLYCLSIDYDFIHPDKNQYRIGTFIPSDKKKGSSDEYDSSGGGCGDGYGGISDESASSSAKASKANQAIKKNAEDIEVNAHNIAVNANDIAVNAHAIEVQAEETITIKARVLTLGERTDGLEQTVTNINTDITNINSQIINLGDADEAQRARIGEAERTITNINTNITNINSDLVNIGTDIDTLEDTVTNINTDITNINSRITNIGNRTSDNEQSIVNINADLTNIDSDIVTINGRITDINTQITSLETTLSRTIITDSLTATRATVISQLTVGSLLIDVDGEQRSLHIRQIKMDNVQPGAYVFAPTSGELSLNHSHSISMSESGSSIVATIGGTQSNNGTASFSIAATNTYKAGIVSAISAAISGCTVQYNYSSSNHNYTARISYTDSEGNSYTHTASNASGTEAYSAGITQVTSNMTISTGSWNSSGNRTVSAKYNGTAYASETVSLPTITMSHTSWNSSYKCTARAYASGVGYVGTDTIDASSVYSTGYTSGSRDGYSSGYSAGYDEGYQDGRSSSSYSSSDLHISKSGGNVLLYLGNHVISRTASIYIRSITKRTSTYYVTVRIDGDTDFSLTYME